MSSYQLGDLHTTDYHIRNVFYFLGTHCQKIGFPTAISTKIQEKPCSEEHWKVSMPAPGNNRRCQKFSLLHQSCCISVRFLVRPRTSNLKAIDASKGAFSLVNKLKVVRKVIFQKCRMQSRSIQITLCAWIKTGFRLIEQISNLAQCNLCTQTLN